MELIFSESHKKVIFPSFFGYKIKIIVFFKITNLPSQAIVSGCLSLDDLARRSPELQRDQTGRVLGGSTSLACWVRHQQVYHVLNGNSNKIFPILPIPKNINKS